MLAVKSTLFLWIFCLYKRVCVSFCMFFLWLSPFRLFCPILFIIIDIIIIIIMRDKERLWTFCVGGGREELGRENNN